MSTYPNSLSALTSASIRCVPACKQKTDSCEYNEYMITDQSNYFLLFKLLVYCRFHSSVQAIPRPPQFKWWGDFTNHCQSQDTYFRMSALNPRQHRCPGCRHL